MYSVFYIFLSFFFFSFIALKFKYRNAVLPLMEAINEKMQKRCEVYLVFLRLDEVVNTCSSFAFALCTHYLCSTIVLSLLVSFSV